MTLKDRLPKPALAVRELDVSFGTHHVLRKVSFSAFAGEVLAIIGPSGSGKSVLSRSLLGLAGRGSRVRCERLEYRGAGRLVDLSGKGEREWRKVRGDVAGLVLQDALVGLDPLRTIGKELDEAIGPLQSRSMRYERACELLERAGLAEPDKFLGRRAGELSGGQRQRALIATAIAREPHVIIADEPTASLDPNTRDQILDLLRDQARAGAAVIFISHDMEAVGQIADRVQELRAGELGPPLAVEQWRHEHSHGELTERSARSTPLPLRRELLLEARDLMKVFSVADGEHIHAVNKVSFELRAGECLGIVGTSGSGKTTLGRLVLGVLDPDEGTIRLAGQEWAPLQERHRRNLRGKIVAVPQDALSSFDPRRTVGEILADALSQGRTYRPAPYREEIGRALAEVGLETVVAGRRPIFLSGGQRQRVAIARALAAKPQVLVADEAVSALDPATRSQVLDVLAEIQHRRELGMLFISHNPVDTARLAHRVLRLEDGRVV